MERGFASLKLREIPYSEENKLMQKLERGVQVSCSLPIDKSRGFRRGDS